MTLTAEDIRFFKHEGYLVKHGVLDPDLTARAREQMWDGAPPRIAKDDPETWVGPFGKNEESDDRDNVRKGFTWKYRAPGTEDWMIYTLATNPVVWGMAEQLLGKNSLVRPDRIRGIYSILPEGDRPETRTTCHVDAHPFHLGVVGYIDRVIPRGGGFTVWPGSHRTFYYDFDSQYRKEPRDTHPRNIAHFNEQPFIDCHGGPGDIVFWHHRLGHSAGHNRSRQIRKAVLYDFRKTDLEQTQEEPPQDDMWRDWSEEIRAAETSD